MSDKCSNVPFQEIMTDKPSEPPTNQPNDSPTDGHKASWVSYTSKKTDKRELEILWFYRHL